MMSLLLLHRVIQLPPINSYHFLDHYMKSRLPRSVSANELQCHPFPWVTFQIHESLDAKKLQEAEVEWTVSNGRDPISLTGGDGLISVHTESDLFLINSDRSLGQPMASRLPRSASCILFSTSEIRCHPLPWDTFQIHESLDAKKLQEAEVEWTVSNGRDPNSLIERDGLISVHTESDLFLIDSNGSLDLSMESRLPRSVSCMLFSTYEIQCHPLPWDTFQIHKSQVANKLRKTSPSEVEKTTGERVTVASELLTDDLVSAHTESNLSLINSHHSMERQLPRSASCTVFSTNKLQCHPLHEAGKKTDTELQESLLSDKLPFSFKCTQNLQGGDEEKELVEDKVSLLFQDKAGMKRRVCPLDELLKLTQTQVDDEFGEDEESQPGIEMSLEEMTAEVSQLPLITRLEVIDAHLRHMINIKLMEVGCHLKTAQTDAGHEARNTLVEVESLLTMQFKVQDVIGDIRFTNEMDWKVKYEEAIEEQKCQMELFLSEEEGMKLEARKYKELYELECKKSCSNPQQTEIIEEPIFLVDEGVKGGLKLNYQEGYLHLHKRPMLIQVTHFPTG